LLSREAKNTYFYKSFVLLNQCSIPQYTAIEARTLTVTPPMRSLTWKMVDLWFLYSYFIFPCLLVLLKFWN